MIFMQFLRSLDDLLFEIVTWLVFFPVTLWRTVRDPLAAMRYADTELRDEEKEQYAATLSPPLFLLLSLLLSHAIEIALVGESPMIASQKGLARLISDDTSLLLVRLVFFSIFPLTLSVSYIAARKLRLSRDTLRPPFYALCYPTGVFALALGIGTLLTQLSNAPVANTVGVVALLGSLLWFGWVTTRWFRRSTRASWWRATWLAGRGLFGGTVAFALVAPLVS